MTFIITFDLEDDLGSSISFQKRILEVEIIWKSGITLVSRHISSKVAFSSVFDKLFICLLANMQIKKFPRVTVVATKLNFLEYTYRFRINHKTLYSQTFPGPHFGSWTTRCFQFTHFCFDNYENICTSTHYHHGEVPLIRTMSHWYAPYVFLCSYCIGLPVEASIASDFAETKGNSCCYRNASRTIWHFNVIEVVAFLPQSKMI